MGASGKKFDLVVLGGINSDYVVQSERLPEPGQTVEGGPLFTGPGGKGANQAVAAARLGARVAMIGRVGNDARGRELAKGLRREKIDIRHVTFDRKTPTGAAIIAVDRSGEKQISAALGANLTLSPKQIRDAAEIIGGAKALLMQFEAPVPCVLAAARIAHQQGVKVILDPAPPTKFPDELLRFIYAIRPNTDEAEQITGIKITDRGSARKAAAFLLRRGVHVVAVEAAAGGDLVMSNEEEIFVERIKVKSVDATGAGDAFAAGFAVGIAENLNLGETARLANATAALSTTKVGAQAGMPKRAAVERLLRTRE